MQFRKIKIWLSQAGFEPLTLDMQTHYRTYSKNLIDKLYKKVHCQCLDSNQEPLDYGANVLTTTLSSWLMNMRISFTQVFQQNYLYWAWAF